MGIRALYYESTAGAVQWRPDCRLEPKWMPSQEKIVWRPIFQATIPGHTSTHPKNSFLSYWFYNVCIVKLWFGTLSWKAFSDLVLGRHTHTNWCSVYFSMEIRPLQGAQTGTGRYTIGLPTPNVKRPNFRVFVVWFIFFPFTDLFYFVAFKSAPYPESRQWLRMNNNSKLRDASIFWKFCSQWSTHKLYTCSTL
jgi:hypothetical protein